MARILNMMRRCIPSRRRLIQLYAALLYNAHLKGFITGNIYTGNVKAACVPGLNCYSCPGAVGACPLGALQNAIASSGSRMPAYILGILMLYGLILGRTICGWLCPAGLVQELLHRIPTPKLKKGRVTRWLSWLKYVILAVFVVAIPLWYALQRYPVPAFCKYICPAGTFEGAVGLLSNPANADKFSMLGLLFTRKFVILIVIAAACVFIYRAFCRFLCPLGAIYGLFAKVAVIGVKVDVPKCVDCGRCVGCCPMDIKHVGDHECISCGKCIGECPTGAISMKAGRIVLMGADRPKRSKWLRISAVAAAIAVLAGALVFFNLPGDDAPGNSFVQNEAAPDFSVPLYGGDEFVISQQRGKVTVLNFWATWCTPCVAELPYFDEIYVKYGDSIAMVAIHSELVTDNVEAYLAEQDYSLPFALDETGDVIKAFGGSTMLPQTVIIDADGNITYNAVGSVTYEKLEALIEAAQ